MKLYMLDTDTCSYIIKQRPDSVQKRLRKLAMDQICISVITYAELMRGAEQSQSQTMNRNLIEQFSTHLNRINWNLDAARCYAQLCAKIQKKKGGKPIDAMALLIAAHANSIDATLVTNKPRQFDHITKIKPENWT